MQALLEHRLGLNRLELGSEISQSLGAAVRVTPGVGEGVVVVLDLVTGPAPARIVSECFDV